MKTNNNLDDPIKDISDEFVIADKGLVGAEDEKPAPKKPTTLTKKDHEKRVAKAITNVRIAAIYALPVVGLILFFYGARFYYLHTTDEQKLSHLSMLFEFIKNNGIPTAFGAAIVWIFKGK